MLIGQEINRTLCND